MKWLNVLSRSLRILSVTNTRFARRDVGDRLDWLQFSAATQMVATSRVRILPWTGATRLSFIMLQLMVPIRLHQDRTTWLPVRGRGKENSGQEF